MSFRLIPISIKTSVSYISINFLKLNAFYTRFPKINESLQLLLSHAVKLLAFFFTLLILASPILSDGATSSPKQLTNALDSPNKQLFHLRAVLPLQGLSPAPEAAKTTMDQIHIPTYETKSALLISMTLCSGQVYFLLSSLILALKLTYV